MEKLLPPAPGSTPEKAPEGWVPPTSNGSTSAPEIAPEGVGSIEGPVETGTFDAPVVGTAVKEGRDWSVNPITDDEREAGRAARRSQEVEDGKESGLNKFVDDAKAADAKLADKRAREAERKAIREQRAAERKAERETAKAAAKAAAEAEKARLENLETRRNSEEVRKLNDLAELRIYGSKGRKYVAPNGQVIADADRVWASVEQRILHTGHGAIFPTGVKQAEKQAFADAYKSSIDELVGQGFELTQAEYLTAMRMQDLKKAKQYDLREQALVADLLSKDTAGTMTPEQAQDKAKKLVDRLRNSDLSDAQRLELAKEYGYMTMDEFMANVDMKTGKPIDLVGMVERIGELREEIAGYAIDRERVMADPELRKEYIAKLKEYAEMNERHIEATEPNVEEQMKDFQAEMDAIRKDGVLHEELVNAGLVDIRNAKTDELNKDQLKEQNKFDMATIEQLSRKYADPNEQLTNDEMKLLSFLYNRIMKQNELSLESGISEEEARTRMANQSDRLNNMFGGKLYSTLGIKNAWDGPTSSSSGSTTGKQPWAQEMGKKRRTDVKQWKREHGKEDSKLKKWAKRIGALALVGGVGVGVAGGLGAFSSSNNSAPVESPSDGTGLTPLGGLFKNAQAKAEQAAENAKKAVEEARKAAQEAGADADQSGDDGSQAGNSGSETGFRTIEDIKGESNDDTSNAEDETVAGVEGTTTNVEAEPGTGLIREISQYAGANDVEMQDGQANAIYQAAIDQLGPNNIIKGIPLYEISPGNWGISSPGRFDFTPDMVKFMNDRLGIDTAETVEEEA